MLTTIPQLISQIRQNIQTTTAVEAYLLAQNENSLFIDVREPNEVTESPVLNSINLARGIIEMNIAKCCPDETCNIFLHCATGGRATFAAEQLVRLGYKNVWAIVCPHDEVLIAQKKVNI